MPEAFTMEIILATGENGTGNTPDNPDNLPLCCETYDGRYLLVWNDDLGGWAYRFPFPSQKPCSNPYMDQDYTPDEQEPFPLYWLLSCAEGGQMYLTLYDQVGALGGGSHFSISPDATGPCDADRSLVSAGQAGTLHICNLPAQTIILTPYTFN